MSDGSTDTSQSSRRKPNRIDWGAIVKAASRAIGLHEDGFKLPPRLFEQLPFACLSRPPPKRAAEYEIWPSLIVEGLGK
jgi:hypothetical protein